MPEGHTIHRLARRHKKLFGGRRVRATSPQGRFVDGAARIDGRRLLGTDAWGKHLLHRYEGELLVHVHLGLYGRFDEAVAPLPAPVGQVRLRIEGDEHGVDLRGPTACEIFTPADVDDLVARLGADPLRRDSDPEAAAARVRGSRRAVGALLMDQKVIAGVGNVYRAEVLFRAGVHPFRPGTSIVRDEWDDIWADLVDLMAVGVRRGRIVTVRADDDHGAPSYRPGRPRTYVYRRRGEPCRICGTSVVMADLDARKVYWCPVCQPE
ncbi:Fpg/Nei family DNA glycosylase [Williamsia sterculiae]|uniref:DNA-(apurinic or apyrimidinic site) lyase n=1 Tax=Williamsia sterculiae TaxID=1344003 RepID=A0A1N7GK97_9NOCA|nr:DNA-formamidopyrimidine glycosylase family protein [Williamsia sterculiae]SIS12918.1 endonuclease-8 [Williamsia sterculiae]